MCHCCLWGFWFPQMKMTDKPSLMQQCSGFSFFYCSNLILRTLCLSLFVMSASISDSGVKRSVDGGVIMKREQLWVYYSLLQRSKYNQFILLGLKVWKMSHTFLCRDLQKWHNCNSLSPAAKASLNTCIIKCVLRLISVSTSFATADILH